MQTLKKKIPTVLNLTILLISIVFWAGGLFLFNSSIELPLKLLGGASFIFAALIAFMILHEAIHNMAAKNKKLNYFIGVIAAALFPTSFSIQKIFHMGHHSKNRGEHERFDLYTKDESRIKKWIGFNCIINGVFWLTTIFSSFSYILLSSQFKTNSYLAGKIPAIKGMAAGFNGRENKKLIIIELLAVIAVQGLVINILNIELLNYLALFYAYGVVWGALQYVFHAFTELDTIEGSRDLYLPFIFRIIILNFNYHLVHHRKPNLPWIYLPEYADEKRPKQTVAKQYLKMWAGPVKMDSIS